MELSPTLTEPVTTHGPVAGTDAPASEARIGPNAILQVMAVVEHRLGPEALHGLMEAAGLAAFLAAPPGAMVDERHVVRLHQTVREILPPDRAGAILDEAGRQTAAYILANRIPKPAQIILKALPARVSAPALLAAIARHAWTFAGSGRFAYHIGWPAIITLSDCPACEEVYEPGETCAYYRATMEGLFQALVHARAQLSQKPTTERGTRSFALSWP